ncbi:FAD-binding oxidoreductase, partial [Leptospira gomenensis]
MANKTKTASTAKKAVSKKKAGTTSSSASRKKTTARSRASSQPNSASAELRLPAPSKVEAWGMNHFSLSPVLFPETQEEFQEIFSYANRHKLKLTFRGGGCSYGDAATNTQGAVVDISKFNRILEFDSQKGILKAE